MRTVLNLGCGANKVQDKKFKVINLDANKAHKPDIVCNLIQDNIPLPDKSVDTIWMFHMIEHITRKSRGNVLLECNRVLKVNGNIIFTYPEFEKCATNLIENKFGDREFWEATLYGRQSDVFDFHVVPMISELFKHELIDYGFGDIKIINEERDEYNTILDAVKIRDIVTREEILAEECCKV